MKIVFLWIGKCKQKELQKTVQMYQERLKHYAKCDINELTDIRGNKTSLPDDIKKEEGSKLLKAIKDTDYVVLLDEMGSQLTSLDMAQWLQHKMNISISRVIFVICGAFGASVEVKKRADYTLSLSRLTMTHDMARVLIIEQVYRSMTILKGESYHNP